MLGSGQPRYIIGMSIFIAVKNKVEETDEKSKENSSKDEKQAKNENDF